MSAQPFMLGFVGIVAIAIAIGLLKARRDMRRRNREMWREMERRWEELKRLAREG